MNTGAKKKKKYEREIERIEQQDREEETNEGIPRIVLDPCKKVTVNKSSSMKKR